MHRTEFLFKYFSKIIMQRDLLRVLILLQYFSFLVRGQFIHFPDETSEVSDSATVTKDWHKLEDVLKESMKQLMKKIMPLLMDNQQDLNISSTCIKQILHVLGGIKRLETWAMRFLDSNSKGFDGLLTGSLTSFGAYDECVETVAVNQRSGKQQGEVMYSGKYCLLRIYPSLPPPKDTSLKTSDFLDELKDFTEKQTIVGEFARYGRMFYFFSFRLAVCVPSGCSVDDLNQVIKRASDYINLHMKVRCDVKEDPKFTTTIICVIFAFSFAGLMVFIGTLADIYCSHYGRKKNSVPFRVFLAFSVISNSRKFVDTSSSDTVDCLNGIRCLSTLWVILYHSTALTVKHVSGGLFYTKMMAGSFIAQTMTNGTLSANSFFVLGGFLMSYRAVKRTKRDNGRFNVKLHIIRRLWRILPGYSSVILFALIGEILTSGPIAKDLIFPLVEGCEKNWWTNLLFVNNFFGTDNFCLDHTWYLAVDMQFYIISLIILLPLLRWPKIGLSVAIASIAASLFLSAEITNKKNFPPALLSSNPNIYQLREQSRSFYMMPYPHLSSYAVGIMTGYLLAIHPEIKIPKFLQVIGWCSSVTVTTTTLYGTYGWNAGKEPNYWETIFFSCFHRFAWSLSVAWVIVCCGTGNGGVINRMLSWKAWAVLGRLSFLACLVHVLIINFYNASCTYLIQPRYISVIWLFFGHVVSSLGVAFLGSMLIESPFSSLEKLILSDRHKKLLNVAEIRKAKINRNLDNVM